MTPTRRPSQRRRSSGASASPPVARVRGPADVAAMIPYLLGFQPHESLVLVALEGPRKRFGPVLRIDLPHDADLVEEQAALICRVLTGNGVGRVLLAAFSADRQHADPLVTRVLAELAALGVTVEDAFRADGARLWSYLCADPGCCSPEGVAYDVTSSSAAAEAVLAGMAFEPDRDTLRSWVGPGEAKLRQEVASEVSLLVDGDQPAGPFASSELRDRIRRSLDDPAAATAADLAWLACAVQPLAGRDAAVGMVDRGDAGRHFELWRQVLRAVDDELLPSVGCIAAFSAWLDGKGVLASHVLERVQPVDPANSFLGLLAELLAAAVNPRSWDLVSCAEEDDAAVPPSVG